VRTSADVLCPPAEKSESIKPDLERLREDTARLFHEANDLKQRWAYLDEAQRAAYRVRRLAPSATYACIAC